MNIQALFTQYGSPLYVYDLALLRLAYQDLRRALPEESCIYYSLKANPHPSLVHCLGELGCRTEISSPGELRAVLAADSSPRTSLYTGPGKTVEQMMLAIQEGVELFSVDSPVDLEKLTLAAKTVGRPTKFLLRINPDPSISDAGLTMTGVPSQFGADCAWIRSQPAAFTGSSWASLVGFHVYTGTNITSSDALLHTFEVASKTAREIATLLHSEPEVIDLGGGFGHPFATTEQAYDFSSIRKPLEALLDVQWSGWRQASPQIAFESGRFLVARAGTLYCRVQDVKWSQKRAFVVLDTGIHHLGGMSGLRRIPSIRAEFTQLHPSLTPDDWESVEIVGPLCTPLDYLARAVKLPRLAPDDILAIHNVGAYGLTGSLIAFLSHDTPVEIVLDAEELKDVSQLKLIREYKEKLP